MFECLRGIEQTYLVAFIAYVFNVRVVPQTPAGFFFWQVEWNGQSLFDQRQMSERICVLFCEAKECLIQGETFRIHAIAELLREVVGYGIIASIRQRRSQQRHHGKEQYFQTQFFNNCSNALPAPAEEAGF